MDASRREPRTLRDYVSAMRRYGYGYGDSEPAMPVPDQLELVKEAKPA